MPLVVCGGRSTAKKSNVTACELESMLYDFVKKIQCGDKNHWPHFHSVLLFSLRKIALLWIFHCTFPCSLAMQKLQRKDKYWGVNARVLSYDYVMVIPLVWQCCLWAGSLVLFQENFWRRCCPRGLPKLARRIGRGGIPIAGFAATKISPESHKGLALQFRHFHLYSGQLRNCYRQQH